MKKQIRLLVENLFDELYDIDQESDLTVDIADNMYQYQLGDFWYYNKYPHAICCSDKSDFNDKKQRFVFFTFDNLKNFQWSSNSKTSKLIKKISAIERDFVHFQITKSRQIRFDEKGYENTQYIKNNFDINYFPAFKYCIEFHNDAYLPAIDELQIMYKNIDLLNDNISKLESLYKENIILYNSHYWSSTQFKGFNLKQRAVFFSIYKDYGFISYDKKFVYNSIQPFIKI